MLEVTTRAKSEKNNCPEVERFLQSDRGRVSRKNHVAAETEEKFSVKNMMSSLQERFSNTGDISSEIEDLVEAQVQFRTRDLFRQANYDALTHLPNRTYFHTTLEKLIIHAQEKDNEFALLFLDLDGFKTVNDTLGHSAGDELLRNVSARLVSAVRDGDIISRLGGDEFVVLLADVTDKEIIKSVNSRIIREVSRPYWINGNEVKISTSIGVARYPFDAKSSTELVERADQALYVSKNAGKSMANFYQDVQGEVNLSHSELVDLLNNAVTNGEIEAVFEPQIDLSSNAVVGASVTAKWNSPEMEGPYLVSWSDLLNESTLATAVGAWLIDSGLYYLQQWQTQKDEMIIAIPVVDKLWQTQNFVEFMNQRMAQYGILTSQVQLEFTAKSLFENEMLRTVLDDLTVAGYQVTISDIGKQSLDLSMLALINLSELKLDRDWLYESMQTERGQKWAQALINMAKKLDLCVIATGVTDAKQADTYRKMGCSMGQGMNWSAPIEPQAFTQQYL